MLKLLSLSRFNFSCPFFLFCSGLPRNIVKQFPFLKHTSFRALPCWFPLDFCIIFFSTLVSSISSRKFPLPAFGATICVGNMVNLYMVFNYFVSYSVKQTSAPIPATHLMNCYCVDTILIYIYNKKIVFKAWTFSVFHISSFIWLRLWDTWDTDFDLTVFVEKKCHFPSR